MTVMNFDLEDGLPKVSFTLKPDDAERFVRFMAECEETRTSLAHWKVFGEHAEGERSRLQGEVMRLQHELARLRHE